MKLLDKMLGWEVIDRNKLTNSVATIIEDRNFCIVYLKNCTITVFYLHVRQNVVFCRSRRTRVFLQFVCSAFPRIVFALAFWETYREREYRRDVVFRGETEVTVETRKHKHVFVRLIVYLSKCINNQ